MDTFDRAILNLMQESTRISTEEIGHRVGLSATACQRRLKRLREQGIIHKEIAVIDGIKAGGYVTVVVEVTLKQGGAQAISDFKTQMAEHEKVQQCYYLAGNADFMVIVISENMLAYEKLTHELFLQNVNIQKFHSNVVMENVKVGLEIPLKSQ